MKALKDILKGIHEHFLESKVNFYEFLAIIIASEIISNLLFK